jgi:phosphate transport system substrate-binding protein
MLKKTGGYILLGCFIYASFIFAGCKYGEMHSVTTIGEITIGVDENESPVIKKETDEFMRLNTNSKITSTVKTTNELFADLLNGDIKTIITDRDFTPQENEYLQKYKIETKKNIVALNGAAIIVNPANPLTKLNFNEMRKIFTGETTDWSNLEGDNKDVYKGKIKPYIARKNSMLHDYFKEKVLLNNDYYKNDLICSTSTQMLNEIRDDKYGIGFISMSWITKFADTLDTTIKPLRVAAADSTGLKGEYVGLHQAYIANRSYPLLFDVYCLSRDFEMDISVGLISFLLSYDGQKIILNSGLVPQTQPVRIIQLN